MAEALALLRTAVGVGLLGIGVVFCLLGLYGVLRLPGIYNRLQAAGKVVTLGAAGVLLSLLFLAPPRAGLKALATTLFFFLTAPMVTHAIARAAHRRGVPLVPRNARDDLAEDEAAGRE